VIFPGSGMNARDVTGAAASSLAVRASLWAAWLLLTAPAAGAIVETPTTFFLRGGAGDPPRRRRGAGGGDAGAARAARARIRSGPPHPLEQLVKRLVVTEVSKILGGRPALQGVSIVWDRPGTLVVFGENGAGKSTLLRVVAGVLAADEGEVSVFGHRLATARLAALRHVGYAPEAADLPPQLGVGELLALVSALKGAPRPPPALAERLGVAPLLGKRLGSLSLGQRRRAGLLAALVGDPDLLLLDEPTNGLDAAGVAMLVELLAERAAEGRAALVATHDRPFIERVAAESVEIRAGRAVLAG
jgi:ABC-2 type transport system ATP-binding protein